MKKIKDLLSLFWAFFKIGLFTFGGGYVMIAVIDRELVDKKHWIEKEEYLDIIAIAESTPGPLAINSATFIGYKRCGVLGSILATLGVVLPSFVIIYCISFVFDKFMGFTYAQYAFKGISTCIIFLIINAGIKMLKVLQKSFFNYAMFIISTVLLLLFNILSISFSSVYFILIGAFISVLLYVFSLLKNKKNREDK